MAGATRGARRTSPTYLCNGSRATQRPSRSPNRAGLASFGVALIAVRWTRRRLLRLAHGAELRIGNVQGVEKSGDEDDNAVSGVKVDGEVVP